MVDLQNQRQSMPTQSSRSNAPYEARPSQSCTARQVITHRQRHQSSTSKGRQPTNSSEVQHGVFFLHERLTKTKIAIRLKSAQSFDDFLASLHSQQTSSNLRRLLTQRSFSLLVNGRRVYQAHVKHDHRRINSVLGSLKPFDTLEIRSQDMALIGGSQIDFDDAFLRAPEAKIEDAKNENMPLQPKVQKPDEIQIRKCRDKCQASGVFVGLAPSLQENKTLTTVITEDDEDEFFSHLTMNDYEKIINIHDLAQGYNKGDFAGKIKFLNLLPNAVKAVIQEQAFPKDDKSDNLVNLLNGWECTKAVKKQEESILFPQAIQDRVNDEQDAQKKFRVLQEDSDLELARLIPDSLIKQAVLSWKEGNDIVFKDHTDGDEKLQGKLKKERLKDYDRMMCELLLREETMYEIYNKEYIFCSRVLLKIQKHITGNVKTLLKNIHHKDFIKDSENTIKRQLVGLFQPKTSAGSGLSDNLLEIFKTLRGFPDLLKMIADKLTDEDLLKETFYDWCQIMNHEEHYYLFKQLIQFFDESTQTKFYDTLTKLMFSFGKVDQELISDTIFQPDFITQGEKNRILEFILENPATKIDGQAVRFWTSDFPIICYLQETKTTDDKADSTLAGDNHARYRLVMLHLAKEDIKDRKNSVTFDLAPDEQFISFVTTTQSDHDVVIQVLVLKSKNAQTSPQNTSQSYFQDKYLVLRTYKYQRPFEYREFKKQANQSCLESELPDSGCRDLYQTDDIRLKLDTSELQVLFADKQSKTQKKTIIRPTSVQHIRRKKTNRGKNKDSDDKIYEALLIQTKGILQVYQISEAERQKDQSPLQQKDKSLKKDDQKRDEDSLLEKVLEDDQLFCHLRLLRAIDDDIYCMLYEKHSKNNYLHRMRFYEPDPNSDRLVYRLQPVQIATVGEIIAFELDPLKPNDYSPQKKEDEQEDQNDYIFTVDRSYMLHKICIARDSYIMYSTNLSKFKALAGLIDEYDTNLRKNVPVHMSISDRCITIGGRTFNLETGAEWSAMISEREDQTLKFKWHQFLPYSNLILTLVKSGAKSTNNEQHTFLVKNAPKSRKLNIMDKRRRDVTMFEMIDEQTFLVQIQCGLNSSSDKYWTMLNHEGQILSFDPEIETILERKEWIRIESKVQEKDGKRKAIFALMAQRIDDPKSNDRGRDDEDFLPEISVFVMDLETRLLDEEKQFSKEKIFHAVWPKEVRGERSKYDTSEESWRNELSKNYRVLRAERVRFKMILSLKSDNQIEVFLIFPDIRKTVHSIGNFIIQEKISQELQVSLKVITTNKLYVRHFHGPDNAILIDDEILIKGPSNQIIRLTQSQNTRFLLPDGTESEIWDGFVLKDLVPVMIYPPRDATLLTHTCPFYRQVTYDASIKQDNEEKDDKEDIEGKEGQENKEGKKDKEDKKSKKHLIFPAKVQLCYGQSIGVCELTHVDMLQKDKNGYLEEYEGVEFLMDPESFVDPGYLLSRKVSNTQRGKSQDIVWRHLVASKSPDLYYLTQDYWRQPNTDEEEIFEDSHRSFSFHGLYRKFSEADLFEAIRIKNLTIHTKPIKEFDKTALFCSIKGSTIFSIFFKEITLLILIREWIENTDFPSLKDQDGNEVENPILSKIFAQLKVHQIHTDVHLNEQAEQKIGQGYDNICQKLTETRLGNNEDSTEDEMSLRKLLKRVHDFFKVKQQEKKEDLHEIEENQISSNSLLYRALYSENQKSRDLILQVAGFCKQFTLTDVFICLSDCHKLLQTPSQEVISAFDNVLKSTKKTEQVLTLNLCSDKDVYHYLDKFTDVKTETVQEKVNRELQENEVLDEERIVLSVNLTSMNLSWLTKSETGFLDLVENLLKTKNKAIFHTSFVKSILNIFQDGCIDSIQKQLFIPFALYMILVQYLMVNITQECKYNTFCKDGEKNQLGVEISKYMMGAYLVFTVNQVQKELTQIKDDRVIKYITDPLNYVDMGYILLSFATIVSHAYLEYEYIEKQRIVASLACMFLWVKFFLWLRLFKYTAFNFTLVMSTIDEGLKFMLIMFVFYMMFGSAFYIIDLNRSGDDNFINDVFYGSWILNSFLNMHELGLGEFSIDDYDNYDATRTSAKNDTYIYLLFILASFFLLIVMMNLLVGIMAEKLSEERQQEHEKQREAYLNIMGEYKPLLNKKDGLYDEYGRMAGEEELDNKPVIEFFQRTFTRRPSYGSEKSKDPKNASQEEKLDERKRPKWRNLLYQIEVEDESRELGSWDGAVNILKRNTQKVIQQSNKALLRRLDKLQENIDESASQEKNSDRELKSNLKKIVGMIQKTNTKIAEIERKVDNQNPENHPRLESLQKIKTQLIRSPMDSEIQA